MPSLLALPTGVQIIAAVSAAIVAAALVLGVALLVRRFRDRRTDTTPPAPVDEAPPAALDAEATALDDTPTTVVHRPVRLPGGHYVQPRPCDGGRLARHGQAPPNERPVWQDGRHALVRPDASPTIQLRVVADTTPRRHSVTHPDGIPVVAILTRWGMEHLDDPTAQMQAVAR